MVVRGKTEELRSVSSAAEFLLTAESMSYFAIDSLPESVLLWRTFLRGRLEDDL